MRPLLEQLISQIESRLDWGDRSGWTNRDFQELSELIFESTAKQLSVTTLKRIWGRAKLSSQPSVSTLDILAEFAGYHSWREFSKNERLETGEEEILSIPIMQTAAIPWLQWGILGIGLISIFWVSQLDLTSAVAMTDEERENIQFEVEKVAAGYPNTVIFKYDIGDFPYDSLDIQQSWDVTKRIRLSEPEGLVTTTYYEPGYFTTKLVIDNQIVQTKDLYIPTHGWQGIVSGYVPEMYYVKEKQLQIGQTVRVDQQVLAEMNEHPFALLLLSNLSADPHIDSKNATIETEFRLAKPIKNSKCLGAWMTIIGSKEVYRFQFSIPGCVGELNFFLNMEMISGRNHDLSAFGLDLTEWTRVRVDSKDSVVSVQINDEAVFEHQLSSDIGQIGGVQMGFEGIGEIRSLTLTDEDEVVDLIRD